MKLFQVVLECQGFSGKAANQVSLYHSETPPRCTLTPTSLLSLLAVCLTLLEWKVARIMFSCCAVKIHSEIEKMCYAGIQSFILAIKWLHRVQQLQTDPLCSSFTKNTVISGLHSAPINMPHLLIFKRKKKLYINKPRLSISRRCPRDCGQASRHSRLCGQISRHGNSTAPIILTFTVNTSKPPRMGRWGQESSVRGTTSGFHSSLHSVSLSFALSMSLSSRGKSALELALSSSSRRVHTGRWSAVLRRATLRCAVLRRATLRCAVLRYAAPCYATPCCAVLRREAIVSACLFSPLAASVSRQETHWKMSCMCDHGAEPQDDRRGEMCVRCKQPSAGALGISVARRFGGASASGVNSQSTQQSSLKEPIGDGGFFDTAPRC